MEKQYTVNVFPENICFSVPENTQLLSALRKNGVFIDSVCGGNGSCGKCSVLVDGEVVKSCRYTVTKDVCVSIESQDIKHELESSFVIASDFDFSNGARIALDIGTTTVVCALVDSNGKEYVRVGDRNPQTAYGADVISRIRYALNGGFSELTALIRTKVNELVRQVCAMAKLSPEIIDHVTLAGNPAMQQMFLSLALNNLTELPYHSVINSTIRLKASDYIYCLSKAELIVIPDVAAYIGGDTMSCMLATEIYASKDIKLIVDIGTNGELVLGSENRILSCSTAAGPALEGAGIRFGMRSTEGAIKSFSIINNEPCLSVVGNCAPKGICGSGLVDAVASYLDAGLIDARGNIKTDTGLLYLSNDIYLTREDIQAFQTAKGAIAAGIDILAMEYGIEKENISTVELAGSFGSNINVISAVRTGLLPFNSNKSINAIGNAACDGAVRLLENPMLEHKIDMLLDRTKTIDLAVHPSFKRLFAKNMYFNA